MSCEARASVSVLLVLAGACLAVCLPALSDEAAETLSRYAPQRSVTGILRIQGTAAEGLVGYWADAFRAHHPGLQIYVEGGVGDQRSALNSGWMLHSWRGLDELAPRERAEQRGFLCGAKAHRVAMHAAVVFVHRENPIRGLTLEQLRAIYTGERRADSGIRTWGQLGLEGVWAKRPVTVYAPTSWSGVSQLFRERILGKTRLAKHVNERSVREVARAVADDPCGIGYSRCDLSGPGVRLVPLAVGRAEFVVANRESVGSGLYPLARPLYLVHCPSSDPTTRTGQQEFLRFVYSKDGQEIVQEGGYWPLTDRVAFEEASRIGR